MIWTPHATVACIVERAGKYLCVEEKSNGQTVLNQPAGHVEEHESILAAAKRETLEETGWSIELTGLIGFYTYTAPQNGVTYHRYCFAAKAMEHLSNELDDGIIAAHWLTLNQLESNQDRLRSPLVLKCLYDYINKPLIPLDVIYEHHRA